MIKSKTPSIAKPSNLKGNNKSQNIGYKISATIASGQEIINRIIKNKKVNIVLYLYKLRENVRVFLSVHHNV